MTKLLLLLKIQILFQVSRTGYSAIKCGKASHDKQLETNFYCY